MSLIKLRTAPLLLIEDTIGINTVILVHELISNEKSTFNFFCYEQDEENWKNVFKNNHNISYRTEYEPQKYGEYTNNKGSVFIDSLNQMVLDLGWKETCQHLRKLQRAPNVTQVIAVLHKDCLIHGSKLQINLNHIANAIVSYDVANPKKVQITLKKSGKVYRTEELLSYDDKTRTLTCRPIVKEDKKEETQTEQVLPSNLSTFKIEVEESDKIEKYKLKLPYMSKINEGQGRVFYEPDAVDDWDEEDPDDDLDI